MSEYVAFCRMCDGQIHRDDDLRHPRYNEAGFLVTAICHDCYEGHKNKTWLDIQEELCVATPKGTEVTE